MNNTIDQYLIKGGAGRQRTGPYQRLPNPNALQGNYLNNSNNTNYEQSFQTVSNEKENTMSPMASIYSPSSNFTRVQPQSNYESNFPMQNNGFPNLNQYNSGYNENQGYTTQPLIADQSDFDQSFDAQQMSMQQQFPIQQQQKYRQQPQMLHQPNRQRFQSPLQTRNQQPSPMQQLPTSSGQMQQYVMQNQHQLSNQHQMPNQHQIHNQHQMQNQNQIPNQLLLQPIMPQSSEAPLMVEMGNRFPRTKTQNSSFNQGNPDLHSDKRLRFMDAPSRNSMSNIAPIQSNSSFNSDSNDSKISCEDKEGDESAKIVNSAKLDSVATTATVQNALNLKKTHPDGLYEVYGSCVNVRSGKYWCERIILLRDHTGPVMQVSFFEIDRPMEEILPGDLVRVVGKMTSNNRMTAYSVRKTSHDEFSTVSRLYGVSVYHMKKNNK